MNEIKSAQDAFAMAITLAATAPNLEKAQQCLEMAFDCAKSLTPEDIGKAFMVADAQVDAMFEAEL